MRKKPHTRKLNFQANLGSVLQESSLCTTSLSSKETLLPKPLQGPTSQQQQRLCQRWEDAIAIQAPQSCQFPFLKTYKILRLKQGLFRRDLLCICRPFAALPSRISSSETSVRQSRNKFTLSHHFDTEHITKKVRPHQAGWEIVLESSNFVIYLLFECQTW